MPQFSDESPEIQLADRIDGGPTLAATGAPAADASLAEPAHFRMMLVSFLAACVGLIAGCVAFLLYKLIGLFTNVVFYHRFVADFTSARHHHLGPCRPSILPSPESSWPSSFCFLNSNRARSSLW